jgi:hypothetical protein
VSQRTTRFGRPSGRVVTVLAAATVSAAIAAPLATGANEGKPLRGGTRNGTYTSETKVISRSSSFGTRQSNLGSGGGAIYGCRANAGKQACIEASNLKDGQAFNFRFNGSLGGVITTDAAKKDEAKPFTTNATGVATGLNADRVDGLDAQQIVDSAAAKSTLRAALVTDTGALKNARGIKAAARESAGRYLITADQDITNCVPLAVIFGPNQTPGATVTLEPIGATQLRARVITASDKDTDPVPVDRQISVAITC